MGFEPISPTLQVGASPVILTVLTYINYQSTGIKFFNKLPTRYFLFDKAS